LTGTIIGCAVKVHNTPVNPENLLLALYSSSLSEAETCADNPDKFITLYLNQLKTATVSSPSYTSLNLNDPNEGKLGTRGRKLKKSQTKPDKKTN